MQKNRRFDFRVSVQEKTEIRDLAALSGMTVSAYVRETALGYESISLIDIKKIEKLIQKNAELARLGNLLKIWLFDDSKLQTSTRMKIENKLRDAFAPVHLEVQDESHMHSGGPNAESHFKVVLVTPKFSGERLINRHRAVNKILADELMNDIDRKSVV